MSLLHLEKLLETCQEQSNIKVRKWELSRGEISGYPSADGLLTNEQRRSLAKLSVLDKHRRSIK